MAVTVPHTIAALPGPVPSTADPISFDPRADATLGALPQLITDTNSATYDTYSNAVDAHASAVAAAAASGDASTFASQASASATAAASSAGAPLWVSGTTYALGAAVWSSANRLIYRRIVAGAGTTDPSLDVTNWAALGTLSVPLVIVTGTTQTAINGSHYVLTNGALSTLTLPLSPTAGDTVWITPANGRKDNIVARNGQTIMGLAEDLILNTESGVQLRFVSSSWRVL